MTKFVRIRTATPPDGRRARIEFTDGSHRDVDLAPFLSGPVFQPIREDPAEFAAMRVDAECGTIVWPNGADIDPDVLYRGLAPAWADGSQTLHAEGRTEQTAMPVPSVTRQGA